MKILTSMECKMCGYHVEDLKHIFWECKKDIYIWQRLVDWLNEIYSVNLECDPLSCLFYTPGDRSITIPGVVGLIMLETKKSLWNARCKETPLFFVDCLKKIRTLEHLEGCIAVKNNNIFKNSEKWGAL